MIAAMLAFVLTACQDKDIDRDAVKLPMLNASEITGQLVGDDYVWSWPSQTAKVQVTTYRNGTLSGSELADGNSFTHKNVPTNVPFDYVFKLVADGNI
jgi:hypothetical protein